MFYKIFHIQRIRSSVYYTFALSICFSLLLSLCVSYLYYPFKCGLYISACVCFCYSSLYLERNWFAAAAILFSDIRIDPHFISSFLLMPIAICSHRFTLSFSNAHLYILLIHCILSLYLLEHSVHVSHFLSFKYSYCRRVTKTHTHKIMNKQYMLLFVFCPIIFHNGCIAFFSEIKSICKNNHLNSIHWHNLVWHACYAYSYNCEWNQYECCLCHTFVDFYLASFRCRYCAII